MVDDVALIHHDKATLQEMMDCTSDVARRYHIEFGAEKCKVVKTEKNTHPPKQNNIRRNIEI